MIQDAFWGILIPFLGTSLGAGCVFFLKKSLSDGIQRALTGFAAGVMVAASVWSLLIPAMEQAADLGRLAFFPAAVGFWLGILFLLLLDHLIPHLHQNSLQAEGPKSQLPFTVYCRMIRQQEMETPFFVSFAMTMERSTILNNPKYNIHIRFHLILE